MQFTKFLARPYCKRLAFAVGIQNQAFSPNFNVEAPKDLHSKHIPAIGDDDESINQYLSVGIYFFFHFKPIPQLGQ